MDKNKKGFKDKIINTVLNVLIFIFSIILLITIYNNIQTKIFKNSYSSFFGYSIFEVQTGSMADTINPGDWIIVKYQRSINLKDIITYEQNGNFITHRVVEIYKETLVTKGDFNNTKDTPIKRSQVVGKVVKILPNFGIFRKTLFNPFVLLTLIITLYLAGSMCKNKKIKNQENNLEESKEVKRVVMKNLFSNFINTIKEKCNKKEEKSVEEQLIFEKKIENNSQDNINTNKNENTNTNVETASIEEKEDKIVIDSEVVEETINNATEEILEKATEEDLEKTMFFRMVSVDQDEIDSVYSDNSHISEKESKVSKLISKPKINERGSKKLKSSTDIKDTEVQKELELLQKKKRKFRNILEKVMYIKTTEVSELIEILNKREKPKPNESSIKKAFLNAYIDGKYYNYCGDVNAEYNSKNMTSKISEIITNVAKELVKGKETDLKYQEKVKKYEKLFTVVLYLEQAFLVEEDIQTKRENYYNKIVKKLGNDFYTDSILKCIIDDSIKLQKTYKGMIKCSFEKLDTNMFELDLENTLSKSKKIYAALLKHNIAFSKVYSDYIVDKTYQEGIVAEDKIQVLLTLLLRQISMDMLDGAFNKKYVIYVPNTLYAKEKKFYNMLKTFDDEFAKNSIILLINYNELSDNSKLIKDCVKNGYHFAVDLESVEKIKVKDNKVIGIMDYIFMGRRSRERKALLTSFSEEINEKVLYVDTSKFGDSWGSER